MRPIKKIFRALPLLSDRLFTPPSMALRSLTSKSGRGVFASTDTLFKGAIFGRDSLEVAEDLIDLKPRLVSHIILTIASLQGQHSSDLTEEEHGKIVHEYRTAIVDGRPLDDMSRHIFRELSSRWGGSDREMAYYGSIDATPQFIKVLGMYCQSHGPAILKTKLRRRNGEWATVKECLILATDWLSNKLADSGTGLLEYKARNPKGIENQVWKDSAEFYVHKNGERANHRQPIASIEVQALAYDAFFYAAALMPERKKEYDLRAQKLRDRTIELLWKEDSKYFALGVDHRDDGSMRLIETITANPAALLDSWFFHSIPQEDRVRYLSGIVRNIMGPDFLTDAGVRSRSLSESNLVKYWDYHGSFTTWPKETYDVAKGMRRQGFSRLAVELENRLLNVVRKSGNYPEFVYVDKRGRVLAGSPTSSEHGGISLIDSTNKPESIQAWTVSAVVAITSNRAPDIAKKKSYQREWQKRLEQEILAGIPHVPSIRGLKALDARYPDYPYHLKNMKR